MKHILEAVNDNLRTVGCVFEDYNKVYVYKIDSNVTAKAGDFAVVESDRGGAFGFKIVQIVEVHDEAKIDYGSDINYKWVVQVFNKEAYEARLERERQVLRELKRMEAKKVRDEYLSSLGEDVRKVLLEKLT